MHQSFETLAPTPPWEYPKLTRDNHWAFTLLQFPGDQGRHLLSQPWSTYWGIYRAIYCRGLTLWSPYIEISN